jgi:hypothetical protein
MIEKIVIDGVNYNLDVTKAKSDGCLTEQRELKQGDVFVRHGYCNQLLVECAYNTKYQLLGMGCGVNSNDFYEKIHTLKEIEAYLDKEGYKFLKNINEQVAKLVG